MSLEQRLSRLEAIEDVRQLKARYFHACDNKQPDVVRECFAAGKIELHYGRIGSFDDRAHKRRIIRFCERCRAAAAAKRLADG